MAGQKAIRKLWPQYCQLDTGISLALPKSDYYDIAAAHRIVKRDVGIAYATMRKIHYNVMRFGDALALDEAVVIKSKS